MQTLARSPFVQVLAQTGVAIFTGLMLGLVGCIILAALSGGHALGPILLALLAEFVGKRYGREQVQEGDVGFGEFVLTVSQVVVYLSAGMGLALGLDSLPCMGFALLAGVLSPFTLERPRQVRPARSSI